LHAGGHIALGDLFSRIVHHTNGKHDGFNEIGANYLKSIKKELTLPLISNYTDNKDLLELEYKVNSIYSLKMKNINNEIKNEYNKPEKK
jgi:hypothetical protein